MKKIIFCLLSFVLCPLSMIAGVTTYTFTSKTWASKVGATVCDRVSDGWICDHEASDDASANNGRTDAQGRLYSQGVKIEKAKSGAGATSVKEFEQVRRITFNFCQNNKAGKGVIYVQIGDNDPDSIVVNRPANDGVYNRDSIITFTSPQTGKIKFWVTCTESSLYINTISIRAANGGSSVFTMDTYQLVTDVAQLQDSDQVIFGVYKDGVDYIMGYYDEWESVNNIHAIKGKYNDSRDQVDADDRAIYTLRVTELKGETAYIFQDELRYEEAYLVASGGKTKNRLALWTDVVDANTYGNYGYWAIAIENGGEAVITNLGNSVAKIIQYNAFNTPTLFACYQERSQTPICLFRRVEAMGDVEAIVAPMVNFGTTVATSDSRTIEVNANKLTEDISVSLKDGSVFSISSELLDRDGDNLTISYSNAVPGHYTDTLVLQSGSVRTEQVILLSLLAPINIAEAVHMEDHSVVFLKDVVVTKKFDKYIYIRDETGSMLIFDRGNGNGAYYGSGLKAGDPLSRVTGRMLNYYGVPELSPTAAFSVGQNKEVLPEPAPDVIDSVDVCRYLQLDSAVVSGDQLTYKGKDYAVTNKFNLPGFIENIPTRTTCIVSYDQDVVTLYIVAQETYPDPEGVEQVQSIGLSNRLVLRNGQLFIQAGDKEYTLTGQLIVLR